MPDGPQSELSTSGRWAEVDRAVLAFEAAGRAGRRPDPADFLPVGPARRAALRELTLVDLERRLAASEPARVEDYLGRFPELVDDDEAVLALAAREYKLRKLRELDLSADEYPARFPRLADRLGMRLAAAAAPTTGALADTPTPPGDGPAERPFRSSAGPFELLGELGRGGMGVVYCAFDRRRRQVVALKTMRRGSPEALYRFKKEFRSRADLTHPNLVNLYELVAEDEQWYFTMELVEGVTFLRYVRYGSDLPAVEPTHRPLEDSAGLSRLRAALRQLAAGVAALHAAGKLHRDLKPCNVLVTRPGRVVVLDFGLATEMHEADSSDSTDGRLLGTVPYMAPEQAACRRASPASDWYSVGVILYEVLTGRRPFEGTTYEIIQRKQACDPLPPGQLAPGAPADLADLCVQLLHREPDDRPRGDEVLRRLSGPAETSSASTPSRAAESPLVGRESHLAALARAWERVRQGKPTAVLLSGRSGAGKTSLARRFLDRVRGTADAVVLEGQCFEQEAVPYKAFDSVVDALSRLLTRILPAEKEAVLPRDVPALTRVFPVLQRAMGSRRRTDVPDPQELRRRAFRALRELLARLGDRRPLVICVDDLQWGDADSAALLAELLQPPDPPVLLLLGCYRNEEPEAGPFLAKLADLQKQTEKAVHWTELAIDALTAEEARDLAEQLLSTAESAEGQAATIARESGGNPFFVHELTRAALGKEKRSSAPVSLDQVLWDRIRALPEAARDLLAVVATAARPIDQEEACRAAAPGSDALGVLAELRSLRLVRGAGASGEDIVAPYHDRVRETVAAHLPAEVSRDVHRRLARTLEAAGRADPELLAVHFRGAGEAEHAGHYFAQAADAAAETLAFDQAARLYRLALELRPAAEEEEWHLRTKLGDALANAGRGAEAAEVYIAAAAGAPTGGAIDLRRRAAVQYLITGHADIGRSMLQGVLAAVGMRVPTTPRRTLLALLARRLQLRLRGMGFRPRDPAQLSEKQRTRLDVCWSAAIGLGNIDTIRGAYFQVRCLLLALRAGDPFRITQALALEAALVSTAGGPARDRTARLLAASHSLARRVAHPHTSGLVSLARGVAAFQQGCWKPAFENSADAEAVFSDQCVGMIWELATSRMFALISLAQMGHLAELSRRWPPVWREARDRGNLYALTSNALAMAVYYLAADEPDMGKSELRDVAARWSQQGFHVQHHLALLARVHIDLYRGDGPAAHKAILDSWAGHSSSLLFRLQRARLDVRLWRARSALASARMMKDQRPLLAAAERDVRLVERERMPWSDALAELAQAGIAEMRGQADRSVALLTTAATRLAAADMPLAAACARRRLGRLLGGENGREMVEAADAWMAGQRVRNPARMTQLYAPGFRD
jgi:serine/threonine protein kinase